MNRVTTLSLISITALACGLTGCGKSGDGAGASSPSAAASEAPGADLSNGRAVFARICSLCHQPNGQGVAGVFPPLAGSQIATEKDPRRIIRIVLNGFQGPVEVSGKTYNNIMTPQGALLSDRDIADVLSYVRSSWGNDAPEVAAKDVAAIRAAIASHPGPWTWEELSKL
jgi:mono/diheme cytochrome c family protein